MARPRHDRAATEPRAITAPGRIHGRQPLICSLYRQTIVRIACQRSIRVTGLGELLQWSVTRVRVIPYG